jgi:endonuclease III
LQQSQHLRFKRWDQINVAVDVHVRRVWRRAGLCADDSVAAITSSAARLHPRYPGELDYPLWLIGSGWCRPRRADCAGQHQADGRRCPLASVCPKVAIPVASNGAA